MLIGTDHPNLHLYTEIKSGNSNKAIVKLGFVWRKPKFTSLSNAMTNNTNDQDTSTDNLI